MITFITVVVYMLVVAVVVLIGYTVRFYHDIEVLEHRDKDHQEFRRRFYRLEALTQIYPSDVHDGSRDYSRLSVCSTKELLLAIYAKLDVDIEKTNPPKTSISLVAKKKKKCSQ